MKTWKSKDPDDVLEYPLDWADQMTEDSDTIASYDPFVESGDVEVMAASNVDGLGDAPSFTATTTLVWLEGGTAGTEAVVVNRITTTGGRQYDHSRKIKIKEL